MRSVVRAGRLRRLLRRRGGRGRGLGRGRGRSCLPGGNLRHDFGADQLRDLSDQGGQVVLRGVVVYQVHGFRKGRYPTPVALFYSGIHRLFHLLAQVGDSFFGPCHDSGPPSHSVATTRYSGLTPGGSWISAACTHTFSDSRPTIRIK